jgi:hypothetical protein
MYELLFLNNDTYVEVNCQAGSERTETYLWQLHFGMCFACQQSGLRDKSQDLYVMKLPSPHKKVNC